MSDQYTRHEEQHDRHPGLRRSARREQQRHKARHGMRVGARPDSLRPVTVARVEQLTAKAAVKSSKKKRQRR